MRFLIIFALLSVYTGTLSAQIDDNIQSSLAQHIDQLVQENDVKGISVAMKIGENAWQYTRGLRSSSDSLIAETQMPMGSVTKTIVSAVILDMVENEELKLSDTIGQYLKEYEHIDPSISIKQLLNHNSGIANYTDNQLFAFAIFSDLSKIYTKEEVIENFVTEPSFPKGTKQEYSNTNYLLLGMIIESLTANLFEEEFNTRFNQGGQFNSLQHAPFEVSLNDVAHLFIDPALSGTGEVEDWQDNGNSLDALFSAANTAGAYVAKPYELAEWIYQLYKGELLSEAMMDSLLTFDPKLLFGQIPYGLGVIGYNLSCGGAAYGHGGGIIYTTSAFYVPEHDMSLIVMTNDGRGIEAEGGVLGIAADLVCEYESVLASQKENPFDHIKVYPNPASQAITIELSSKNTDRKKVWWVNSLGERICEMEIEFSEGKSTMDVSSFSTGIYQLLIQDGENILIQGVMIE